MTTWHRGKRMLSIQLEKVIEPLWKFQTHYNKNAQHIVSGTAIYLGRDLIGTPSALVFNLRHNKVLHEKIIILSVQFIAVPHVKLLEKIQIHELDKNIKHVIIYYGYLDKTHIPDALTLLKEKGLTIDQDNATYFLGRESIVVEKHTGMSTFRNSLFNIMGKNAVKATMYFGLPPEKVCIIGSQIRL